MRRVWSTGLVVVLVGVAFLGGAWVTWQTSVPRQAQLARKVLYYICPMHAQYRSERAGDCPSCGMRLEPVYADDASSLPGSAVPPRALRVTTEKQQTIGVTTGQAEQTALTRTLRTVGRIAADENRLYRLVTTTDGWVKQVFAGQTGAIVGNEQVLLYFYSREFLSAQASYFFALDALDRYRASGQNNPNQATFVEGQIRTAAETLQGLGMDDIQLAEIARTRKAATDIALRSPTTGYIVARNVYPRQRFERGTELYRIVDISRVWILADLFESDAQYVQPGTGARVSFPYQAEGPIGARVGNALPQFDPVTRTLKLRLEADNPTYALRPDMLVDVELDISLPKAITVPADGVVDSGGRKTVFVDRGNGYFEPRRVETGWRFNERVEIVKGLMPGERIALSGNFLLDSESRMKAAAMGIAVPEVDPVCGMEVDQVKSKESGRAVSYHGQTYYFCSDGCRKRFEATPTRFVQESPPRQSAATWAAPALPMPAPVPGANSDEEIREPGVPTVPRVRGMGRRPRPLTLPSVPRPSATPSKPAEAGGIEHEQPSVSSAPVSVRKTSMDPVCRITVDQEFATAAGLKSEHKGRAYFFVSKECKDAFEKQPQLYVDEEAPAAPEATGAPAEAGAAVVEVKDPVCAMTVDPKNAAEAGLKSDYKGKTYYFCSGDCKKKFDKEPEKHINKK